MLHRYLFIISFLWKITKGIDKKLLKSGFFLSMMQLHKPSMEIIIPLKHHTVEENTMQYHEALMLQKKQAFIKSGRTQLIILSRNSQIFSFSLFLN